MGIAILLSTLVHDLLAVETDIRLKLTFDTIVSFSNLQGVSKKLFGV